MGKTKIKQRNGYSNDLNIGASYIKIIIILLMVFAVFYIITYFVTKEPKQAEVEPTIQYKEIIVGNILNLKEDEYYVLVQFEDDKYVELYKTYLNNYSTEKDSKPYYVVDMTVGFNKSYISAESNLNADKISDIKFSQTTLLKVKSNKIIEEYETNETISAALKNL